MLLSAIILAGGKGKRIGGNKPFKKLLNKNLIDYPIEVLEDLNIPYVLVFSKDLKIEEKYKKFIAFDLKDDYGPLIGILSGMRVLNAKWYLVLPCDCPFISKGYINHLIKYIKIAEEKGCKCIVPRYKDGYVEPLFSLYKRDSLIELNNLINNNKRKIIYLIEKLNPLYIDAERFKNVFANINTPEELKNASLSLTKE